MNPINSSETRNTVIDDRTFQVQPARVRFDALDKPYTARITRKDPGPGPIYTLRNLIGENEARRIIQKSETMGFQAAGLAIGEDRYRVNLKARNNERVMFEDRILSRELWERMGRLADRRYKNRHVFGLNWRFRVYRYRTGARFAPHVDEIMRLPGPVEGLITYFSFMIYLNDDFSGGETTFFARRKSGQAGRGKKMEITQVIRPRTGMALAFDHLLFHEGSLVEQGVKYVLRSDLVYAPLKK